MCGLLLNLDLICGMLAVYRRVALQTLLWLLILPILLVLCTLAVYCVPLPASFSGSRDLIAALSAGVVGAGYLSTLAFYTLRSVGRAQRALDPILAPLGLVASETPGLGRRYTGMLEGRAIEVRYWAGQALYAARLDIAVEAEPGTRMALGWQRPLLDCRDCPRLDGIEGVSYQVYAEDAEAARRWLANPEVRATLDPLMGARGGPELYVQPDRLWFRIRPRHDVRAEAEAWVQALVRLASR
jgi:hypothetical protein